MCRPGQAMVETLLAVLIITSLFLGLYSLSRMLEGKILVEHAALRVARARAVGLNDFMCLKTARVATIPVAGERLHPGKDDERADIGEAALARMYMRTLDGSYADGILRYKGWEGLAVPSQAGGTTSISLKADWSWFVIRGEAVVDDRPVYLEGGR